MLFFSLQVVTKTDEISSSVLHFTSLSMFTNKEMIECLDSSFFKYSGSSQTRTESDRAMELSQSRYHSQQRWESPSREGANLPSLPHRQSPSQHLPGPASLLDNTPNDRPTIPRSERAGSETAPSQASPMQLPPIREVHTSILPIP